TTETDTKYHINAKRNDGSIISNKKFRLFFFFFKQKTAYEIRRIEEILHSRFLHGRVEVNTLVPAPTDDNWITSLPRGFLRNAAAKLSEMANSQTDENSRVIAARALRELYAMKKEVPA